MGGCGPWRRFAVSLGPIEGLLANSRRAFTAACGLLVVHLVADVLLATEPGVAAGERWPAAVVPAAIVIAAAVGYRRLRPGGQAALAAAFAFLCAVGGGVSVAHAATDGVDVVDLTGFALIPAALMLGALGVALLWRSRKPTGHRVARRAFIAVAAIVVALELVVPIGFAWVATHRPAGVTEAADLGRAYDEVAIVTDDGLELAGWYVPSRNGAAVITFPSRGGTADHARLLAGHGYGVLALDARGYGGSAGDPNAFGWGSAADIDAAVAYLQARPEIDPRCVGGLGLSVGGEQMIEAAARNEGLAAVVTEGAGERSVRETLIFGPGAALTLPFQVAVTGATAVFSGAGVPPPLDELAAEIAPRSVLFVYGADGQAGEDLNVDYFEAAGEPKELWRAPGGHTGALDADPKGYEQRVVGFLDRALSGCVEPNGP